MFKQHWYLIAATFSGIFFGIMAGVFLILFHDLPQINSLKQFKPSSSTTVFSSDNKIITKFYIEKRFPVSIETIPQNLISALITIEDKNFYIHSGINLKAIFRAILYDIKAGEYKQGASTLTQQLAKTLFLSSEKSITRKIKEAFLALQIERRYTKNEILELYLNLIYLGSGAYGVEAASQTYFGKSVGDLTLAESALVAGLPKAPSIYSPIKNPDLAKKRRDIVLRQMLNAKVITVMEYNLAKAVKISLYPQKPGPKKAGYFIEYIKSRLKIQFDLQNIFSKGLNIYTTLDLNLQQVAENSIAKRMSQLELRMIKQGIDVSKAQCALIAIDVKTGGVLSMVGGKNFHKSSFNRAVLAKRQPGSAFKPFVYATAIIQEFSQYDKLMDAPLSYILDNNKTWQVNNFSKTFLGEITFRKALALSKNTPVVRLIKIIGPARVIEFAEKAGISSKLQPNLSLALGTSEVSLIELTASYIPFANMGIKTVPFSIIKITDSDSRIMYQNTIRKQSIMSRQNAAIITDMLKAVVLEGTGKNALVIQKDIAGKTGTTDNSKDALFIGFSPDIAVGVWVGNDDSTSLGKYETGAKAALPIWIDYMEHFLSIKPYQYFDIPDGTKMVYMNPDTGEITKEKTSRTVKTLIKIKGLK
ncbi:MAG: PBP1A family penicillin-binding protein [Desulfobacula sp.]|jgi:penicillin-binding protein 1A|uniref:penicillin-binding protein 1A n=1 Tax=Desulfobacula sp. TaxID=2593537 RepID=UPI001DF49D07|nr:PBP1A family penicillin-binding protein [Desulfobacula sp.]MBT4025059.1 PBP1A family penicillin-binding protein [Desulfobacula sp.]MBT4198631.1 PBP1A family penicillin-binding protein [Desulfobacula sp.]MBT4506732.1 PBP1A family penicillin-binding protein [Desulfobacula sp.]MBT4874191.1 PBP1A family penicillin-binding protein [Desulfobacula sp.]